MQNISFEVRGYRPGDEKGIVDLLDLVFEGWPRLDLSCDPLEYWRWKYFENPLGSSIICIAKSGDAIIGCEHIQTFMLKIGTRISLGGMGLDTAVHPDFRGLGIFRSMAELNRKEEIKAGMKVRIGFTFSPILVGYYSRSGRRSRFPHDLRTLARITDINLHLRMTPVKNASVVRYGYNLMSWYNKLRNAFRSIHSDEFGQDIKISEIKSFGDDIDTFWKEINAHYLFIIERTKDYLNWRYCDPRAGKYTIKKAEVEGRILGFIVVRINRRVREYTKGYIVDLLTLPGRNDVAMGLIKDAINYLDGEKVNIMICHAFRNSNHEKCFSKFGFIDTRYKPYFSYEILDEAEEYKNFYSSSANQMYFSYGDYDII